MPDREFDLIVVGGGLGGATLDKAMAERGARVLVLEKEQRFKDRIRGETIWPWGVAELKELGVYPLLMKTCAREARWFDTYIGGTQTEHRDLPATSHQRGPMVNWVHHEMEDVLLPAA